MTTFSNLLEKLLRREDLTTEEASAAMNVMRPIFSESGPIRHRCYKAWVNSASASRVE